MRIPYTVSFNSDEVKVSIKPSYLEKRPQEELELYVEVDPAGYGISSGEILIKFNPTIFTVLEVVPGDLLGPSPLIAKQGINNTEGTVWYVAARMGATHPPTPIGTFLRIHLKIKEDAEEGTYPIEILRIGLADEKINDVYGIIRENATLRILRIATVTTPTYTTAYYTYPVYTTVITVTRGAPINLLLLLTILTIVIIPILIAIVVMVMFRRRIRKRKPIVLKIE